MTLRATFAVLALLALGIAPASVRAQVRTQDAMLDRVRVDEKLERQLPLDLGFRDHTGRRVTLRQYFDGERPVLLTFAYYRCPVLCSMVLNATANGAKAIPWTAGDEYDIVTISIDPTDTPESAAEKRAEILRTYGKGDGTGWHFLVGDEVAIRRATEAAGFHYAYDERQREYAHPAVMMLLTPSGRFARYLYGLAFEPSDIRLGLLEASQGRSISTVERVLIYCYRFDEAKGGYAVVANRIMQIGGSATALILGAFLFVLWRRELRRRNADGTSRPPPAHSQPASQVGRS